MNLVDSSAWLAYFADEKNADYLKDAIEDIEGLVFPTICLHEVFKVVLRSRGEDEVLAVLATMQQGFVVPLDESSRLMLLQWESSTSWRQRIRLFTPQLCGTEHWYGLRMSIFRSFRM